MTTSCDLLVCVAVGPGEGLGILELLDAARCYLDGRYRVIVVDDTGGARVWSQLKSYGEVDYLRNWRRRGFRHLLQSNQRAYRHALDHYDFGAVLRVDTDALITGPGLSSDIIGYLESHRTVGMLGAVAATESGRAYWRDRLDANMAHWRELVEKAEDFGYQRAESALGGAHALSRRCLEDMRRAGYLSRRSRGARIAEDVTTSLFVRALGYEIHEFGGPDQPFALAWRGLPMSKEEIVARKKKIIHSVKFKAQDLRIRGYFARIRRQHATPVRPPGAGAPPAIPPAHRTGRVRVALLCRQLAITALTARRVGRARRRLRTAVTVDPWLLGAWGMRLGCWLPWGAPWILLGAGRAALHVARKLAAWRDAG
jgi:hypothetical protein